MYSDCWLHVIGEVLVRAMHVAQERKFAVRAGPSIACSGLHTVNKLLIVLLLRAPMCRASVGRRFHEDKARQSSYMYCVMFNRHVRDVTSCVGARLV